MSINKVVGLVGLSSISIALALPTQVGNVQSKAITDDKVSRESKNIVAYEEYNKDLIDDPNEERSIEIFLPYEDYNSDLVDDPPTS
ncbi:hypothetical protein MMC10_010072 [Thelotrema lepadinum]|nr:hypothetical protein [Thelotrema lepadinum]